MLKINKISKRLWLGVGIVLVLFVIGCITFIATNHKTEVEELKKGPLNVEKAGMLQEKLKQAIYIGGEYPSYYGGSYTEKGNLVILVTKKPKKMERKFKKILEQEEGIVIRQVKYSLNSLRNLQIEVGEKYEMLRKEGDEETVQLLNDITRTGIRERENILLIGVNNISDKKVRELEKIFGHTDMIRYEGTGKNQ